VEIVVPVTTRQRDLALAIIGLHSFLASEFPFSAHLTIADLGSRAGTWSTAQALAGTLSEVSAVRAGTTRRGQALRALWLRSPSPVLAYLDPDLSIGPGALLPLVLPLLRGQADLAVGTRLAAGARPQRGPRREITSCGYSLLVQAGLGTGYADAQCGFKAISRDRALYLLPLTSESGWFFDTELITLAERTGLRIHEVPVNQAEPPASRPASGAAARDLGRLARRIFRGNVA
jgi:Glycosyl transferase family 2